MALDRQLKEWLPHTVTIYTQSATNSYGEHTFATVGRECAAYVPPDIRLQLNNLDRETTQSVRIVVADTDIGAADKLVLSDGTELEVLSVAVYDWDDIEGLHHAEVMVR